MYVRHFEITFMYNNLLNMLQFSFLAIFMVLLMACSSNTESKTTQLFQSPEPKAMPSEIQSPEPKAMPSEILNILVTPFMNSDDYWGIQPFAVQANQLGIQFHNGFDYFTNQKKVALHAVSDGRVMFVQVFERPPDGAFQINLAWQTSSGQIISYSLEPSAGPADAIKIAEQKILAEKMIKSMTIKAGDIVRQGQLIGYLYSQDEWSHVHMTLKNNNRGREEWLCPAEFMATVTGTNLVSKSQEWANRLYRGSKETKLCNY